MLVSVDGGPHICQHMGTCLLKDFKTCSHPYVMTRTPGRLFMNAVVSLAGLVLLFKSV